MYELTHFKIRSVVNDNYLGSISYAVNILMHIDFIDTFVVFLKINFIHLFQCHKREYFCNHCKLCTFQNSNVFYSLTPY